MSDGQLMPIGARIIFSILLGLTPWHLLAQAPAPASPSPTPCSTRPEYAHFDFWLGQWDVTDNGKVIASSSIEKITGGCIILESYRQSDGYSGKSLNFFDSTLDRWRQTWVDSSGNASEFVGEYRDRAMRFEGESHRFGGERILRRMTLFNLENHQVRQLSERSVDAGRTWTVGYDFRYVRKP